MHVITAFSTAAVCRAETLTDNELITRMIGGDEAALFALYHRHWRLVALIARKIARDDTAIEEIVQDTFQAAWQSASRFQPDRNVAAWLVGIARHQAIDTTRSQLYRARTREEWLGDQRVACTIAALDGPEEPLVLREDVRAALAMLPPPQRQVLELTHYGRLTAAEVAASTGTAVGTVRTRLRLGLEKLRGCFDITQEATPELDHAPASVLSQQGCISGKE